MNLTELKQISLYGRISEARAEYLPDVDAWVVSVRYHTREGEQQDTLGSQRQQLRHFRDIGSAIRALRQAGITTVVVDSAKMSATGAKQ